MDYDLVFDLMFVNSTNMKGETVDYDLVFDSEKMLGDRPYEEVEIDGETKPAASVLFEKEGVVLRADCDGNATFCDLDDNVLCAGKAESGKRFSHVRVRVCEGQAVAELLATKWIDHYPHCDGEYDRWSEIIVDTVTVCCPRQ